MVFELIGTGGRESSCAGTGLRGAGKEALGLFAGLLIGTAGVTAATGSARANGNYTHLWVAQDAVQHVENAELQELLAAPEWYEAMRNGANFPDGGYAVGDGYGEMGHWEPFQTLYLEWIRDTYGPPWSDEGKRHVAFLLGMAAHGLTDQLFDGMYLERHYVFDENSTGGEWGNVDGVTDICFAAAMGPMQPPETWVPADVMAELFAEAGHEVTPQTIEMGQSLVAVAVMYTDDKRTDEATLDKYMELYPWACGHVDDPTVPGSPISLGPPVARYMEVLWGRLHGNDGFDQPLLGAWFSKGMPYEQPRDAGTPDSWISFAMPRGLDKGSLTDESVTVVGPGGSAHPVTLQLYYGNDSHLVNIRPKEDWAKEADYTVTLSAPLATWNGLALEGTRTFEFSTGAAPAIGDVRGSDDDGDAAGEGNSAVGDDTAGAGNSASGCSAGGVGGMRGGSGGANLGVVLLLASLVAGAAAVGRLTRRGTPWTAKQRCASLDFSHRP